MPRRRSEVPTKARFATHCLLSLISVAVFQGQPSKDTNIAAQVLWATIPIFATVIFHIIDDLVNGRYMQCSEECLSQSYATPLSIVLVLLGHFATWTQRYLAVATTPTDRGTVAQLCAIHFAMSFFILSECEYYRVYWVTHRRDRPFKLSSLCDIIHDADNDQNFEECKDCIGYYVTIPHLEFPPQHGWMSRITLMRYLVVPLCSACLFVVALACLNYPIKRLANPDPEGDGFPLHSQFLEVLFTPRYQAFLWLDIQLQRPIRLFNRMLFWTIVECAQGAWSRWHNSDTQAES